VSERTILNELNTVIWQCEAEEVDELCEELIGDGLHPVVRQLQQLQTRLPTERGLRKPGTRSLQKILHSTVIKCMITKTRDKDGCKKL
jgi:hypothetical protein